MKQYQKGAPWVSDSTEDAVDEEAKAEAEAEAEAEADITLQLICDEIVGKSTRCGYPGDIIHFLGWVVEHHGDWLSGFGSVVVVNLSVIQNGEGQRNHSKHLCCDLTVLLQNAEANPLIDLDAVTADRYMEYLMSLRHPCHGGLLRKSAYGNKCSALFQFFCLHNHCGFSEEFCLQLGN